MKSVRIKHLIEYLQQYDPEIEVELDKDGWLDEHWPDDVTEIDMIEQRNIFWSFISHVTGKPVLVINN